MSAKQFRVWQAALSGRYFAGWSVPEADGRWRATGMRYDVTVDIERIVAEAIDRSTELTP